jgi:cyclopropane-fatty-acyl-phospholipid synthase
VTIKQSDPAPPDYFQTCTQTTDLPGPIETSTLWPPPAEHALNHTAFPTKQRMTGILLSTLDAVRSYTGSFAWGPLIQVSRSAIFSLLKSIEYGQLIVRDTDGTTTVCGRTPKKGEDAPVTTLEVARETFWLRLALFADMGFAESYMLGEVACPDLTSFFRIFILNREHLSNGSTLTSSISSAISGLLRKANTLPNALLNISAHYDISNDMFEAFLSPDMTYSCPIWRPLSQLTDGKDREEPLEDAQYRKLDRFIDNAKIKASDHVLEIGTGWGSFAIRAVQRTGCRITSLTLSREQKELAEQRIADAGLTENIEVLICDYRALPMPKEGPYDKVVSIEMLEAVGREFLNTYFECIHKLLKPDGGIAVFQCITMPESRYEAYAKGEDFIRKYIFPGGHLPTVTQLVNSIAVGSKGLLIVDHIENIGTHYAKTLRLWKEKFMQNFDTVIRPALIAEHEGMTEADTALFKRKWEVSYRPDFSV